MTISRLLTVLEKVLPQSQPAEILVLREQGKRFGLMNNDLAWSGGWHKVIVRIRVEEAGRVGEATINSLTLPALRQGLKRACRLAEWGRPGPLLLSKGRPLAMSESAKPLSASPQELADTLLSIGNLASRMSCSATASLELKEGDFAIVNTAGLAAGISTAASGLEVNVAGESGPGRGYGYAFTAREEIPDGMKAFLSAAAKCQVSGNQIHLPAGEYTVVLEPAAVASVLYAAAKLFLSGGSFPPSLWPWQLESELFSNQLNIIDNNEDPRGQPLPIDFEGTFKKPLTLVKQGALAGLCLDNQSGVRWRATSTGHAPPPGESWEPIPRHLVVETGRAMMDDMIGSIEKGILITGLHGLTCLDPLQSLITGTTAGGTLLIEDGKLTQALPNLRFVQNLASALANVEMIGDEAEYFGGLWGCYSVPALKIHSFAFLPATTLRD